MKKYNFSYDAENDDLLLFRPDKKSKGGIEFGNLIIDFDKNQNVVGLQILDAVDFLSQATPMDRREVKGILKELTECWIDSRELKNMMLIKFLLYSKRRKEAEIAIPVPDIRVKSPALVYA